MAEAFLLTQGVALTYEQAAEVVGTSVAQIGGRVYQAKNPLVAGGQSSEC